jgi:hypothetical protein
MESAHTIASMAPAAPRVWAVKPLVVLHGTSHPHTPFNP